MKKRRTSCIRICLLVSVGSAALPPTAFYASDAGGKQGSSVDSTAGQAPTAVKTGTGTPADRPFLQRRNPRYQLCKGDIFDLTFPFTPEFNQVITVQPDGYITLLGM